MLNPIQILLIDDDEDDYINIRGILAEITSSKYKLNWASSYKKGLDALKDARYDAVLLDYRLGEKTGIDLLREAKSTGVTAPFVLLTGYGDLDLDVRAMQTGAADYLIKGHITAPLLERSIRYSMKNALDMEGLSEQKENFRILFNSTFEGIVVHRAGHILDANAAMGEIFGYLPSEFIETPLNKYFRSEYHSVLQTQMAGSSQNQIEAIGIRKDGEEILVSLSSRTIILNGRTKSLTAVRDLTQQKQMEQQILQQDRLASLGLLASSLAHEIGTPLGVIRGRAQMAAKTTDEKLRSNMELITGQIDRVSKLVNSLLHIARGSDSNMTANVNLGAVIQDVGNLMSHEIERHNIVFTVQGPQDVIVRSEAGPLGQVFLNLLINSVHAIEEARKNGSVGPHSISVTTSQDADAVHIDVHDSGWGITPENLRHIFKPFFTTKDIGSGTGLGLATTFKLVQSWGGKIAVESAEKEGTSFTLQLIKGR